jgi:glyoxylase-like metal-dependent hydrolase (beta-lactamase superfamily II)
VIHYLEGCVVGPENITKHVHLVGSAEITDPKDCAVYLLDLGELLLIDAGAGTSVHQIVRNIELLGLDPARLSTVILTHCHIDHIGSAAEIKERFGATVVMHEKDAVVVERGDNRMTAAFWYNVDFLPMIVDRKLTGEHEVLRFGQEEVHCLHTPGHTPGSLAVYLDIDGKRVLFGQDIHGPFYAEFGSDITAWANSMEKLLALDADILCEGHFGVYKTKAKVREYIEHYLDTYSEE